MIGSKAKRIPQRHVKLKLVYTGDEPEYLRYYRRLSPKFPHESTGNQFFDETQFEVYRALGIHTARGVLDDLRATATDHRDSSLRASV